jgi:hypothetical protein
MLDHSDRSRLLFSIRFTTLVSTYLLSLTCGGWGYFCESNFGNVRINMAGQGFLGMSDFMRLWRDSRFSSLTSPLRSTDNWRHWINWEMRIGRHLMRINRHKFKGAKGAHRGEEIWSSKNVRHVKSWRRGRNTGSIPNARVRQDCTHKTADCTEDNPTGLIGKYERHS